MRNLASSKNCRAEKANYLVFIKMKIIFNKNTFKSNGQPTGKSIGTAEDLERLYGENAIRLFQIAFSRVKSREVAEGLVQDVFCDIWERRNQLEILVSIEAYVTKAVELAALNYLRKKIRRRNIEIEIRNTTPTSHHQIEEILYARDRREEINQLVLLLPKRCREIFRLKVEEDKTKEEIAKTFGISKKTVGNQIYKALNFLKVNLQ